MYKFFLYAGFYFTFHIVNNTMICRKKNMSKQAIRSEKEKMKIKQFGQKRLFGIENIGFLSIFSTGFNLLYSV